MHEKIIKVLLMINLCALKVYALLERGRDKVANVEVVRITRRNRKKK